ncbi:hypothetical protein C3Y98_08775 [Methylotenera oryzisoli]|uniref:Uncharacterized protein n=1 Tax=Methylotenera oryzisoli TaxID=2080758 RepID=A0A4Y9VR26_9PROT|nr:hypothetical protein [Methylotenera oryzisoli]TFW70759.1 hypothetical protein C3Y98_08775 [Methylotenera oryzisoli]
MSKPKKMSNLPQALEEKNQQDFHEVTNRIRDAIEKIRLNPKCKPTQSVLAKLALVNRGTINNRKWPLDELKKIKVNRKEANLDDVSVKHIKPNGQKDLSFEERLYLNREELRVWKVKADKEGQKVAQLEAIIKTQQAQIELLKSEARRLADIIMENKVIAIKFPYQK